MANYKVRQEINLTNVTADPVDGVEASWGGGGIGETCPEAKSEV